MDMGAALQTYIEESKELLERMETSLLDIENSPDLDETLNDIFRQAHTIKGSAGLFGLDKIVAFTHHVETLLDHMRNKDVVFSEDLVKLLLTCHDQIKILIEVLEEGSDSDPAIDSESDALVVQLQKYIPSSDAVTATAAPAKKAKDVDKPLSSDSWHISLRFGQDSFRDGMDPLSFIRYLGTIGKIEAIALVDESMPLSESFDPESCYLGFEINFFSTEQKETIESAFDFIRQDSIVRILPPNSQTDQYLSHLDAMPEENLKLGEMLVRCGSLTQNELNDVLQLQASLEEQAIEVPIGDIIVDQGLSAQAVVESAAKKQAVERKAKSPENKSVRVDAQKLDQLIDLVGELVIASAGTSISAAAIGDERLKESASELTRLVEEVRDSALGLRMVQIGTCFSRFNRVVRDVSSELNKKIELVVSGSETELDKSIVELIGDPLMHLVRNAIDHGIEGPATRANAGKSETGLIKLNAYHDSGNVVIEIVDDGKGLDVERIRQKAIDRKLIDASQAMSDKDIQNLIFEPGFSTADQISNLSGRGVGMDVVKRNIQTLGGTVALESKLGSGTRVIVRLPLTLAIIDGFLVEVSGASMVIPLDIVTECVELKDKFRCSDADSHYMDLRGEIVPYINVRQLFNMEGEPPKRENIVVVNCNGIKAGLVVDKLLGEFQTVIKPLGKVFSNIKGVGGSSILGSGDVALILDVPNLLQRVTQRSHKIMGSAA